MDRLYFRRRNKWYCQSCGRGYLMESDVKNHIIFDCGDTPKHVTPPQREIQVFRRVNA